MKSPKYHPRQTVAIMWISGATACRRRVCGFFREAASDRRLAPFYIDPLRPTWREELTHLGNTIRLDCIYTMPELQTQVERVARKLPHRPRIIAPCEIDPQHSPHTYIDNAAIAATAAKFLIGRGYQHLAYIGSADEPRHSLPRAESFRQTAAALGAVYAGSCTISQTRHASSSLLAFLNRLPKPCGIFAYYDQLARDLINFCDIHGFAVPEVFAIVGADDDDDVCEASSPSITSVHIDFDTLGRYACRLIRDGATAARELPPPAAPYIHERDSTLSRNSHARLVNLSLATIRQHGGRISVQELTQQLKVSERMLRLSFQQVLGYGPKSAILHYRLDQARQLLQSTRLPIGKIAEATGFASSINLYRNFTAAYQLSPAAWRKTGDRSRNGLIP